MGPPSPAAQPFCLSSLARTTLPTVPDWTVEGEGSGSGFASRPASAGDVNGDGFDDVVVGAPYYHSPQWDEGRAYVYWGSPEGGLSATPAWTGESHQDYARFGWSVATAGYINGDWGGDIVVGAPDYDGDQQNAGRAYGFLGEGPPFRLRVEVAPTTQSTLTAEGWYTPNPLTCTVVVEARVAAEVELTLALSGSQRLRAIPTRSSTGRSPKGFRTPGLFTSR